MKPSLQTNRHLARMQHELRELLAIFVYVYICIGALLLYRLSIAGSAGVELAHYGYAGLKALVLAKFILLGHIFHLGERFRGRPLIWSVLYQAGALWALLIALSLLEVAIKTLFHGESLAVPLGDALGQSLHRILAESLLMFLILLPYVAFRQLGEVLGAGGVRRLFFAVPAERP